MATNSITRCTVAVGRAVRPFFSILLGSVVAITFVILRIKCVYTFTSVSIPLSSSSQKLSSSRSFLSTTTTGIINNSNNKKKGGRCVVPENIPLDVLYEDRDMLVINKPSGMIMQFVSGSVERAVVSYLNSTTVSAYYGTPLWPWETSTSFEGIVHRIDKETSGILVVAKHPMAAKSLHESFQQRRADKTYLAIAVGLPTTTKTKAKQKQQQTPSSSSTQTETTISSPLIRRNNNAKQKQEQKPSSSSPEELIVNQELEKQQRLLSKQIKNCGRDVDKAIQLLDQQHHRHQQKYDDDDDDDHTVTTPPDPSLEFIPNAVCYNAAMGVCKRAGKRNKALEVFDSMKTRDIIPNIKCFLKAINLCSKNEQPTGEGPLYQKAIDYIMYLKECKLSPLLNLHCVSSAISACGQANQLDAAFQLLRLVEEEQEENSISGDIIIDSSFDDSRKLQLIGCYNAMITACERCEGKGGASPSLVALKDRLAQISRTSDSDNDDDPAVVVVEPRPINNNNMHSSLLLNKEIVVNAPIGRLGTRKRLMGIVSTYDGGRDAKSIVIPLAYNGIHSLNRIVIETGRTHQIRVHMSSVLDCPLVGDPMYASTANNNNDDDNNNDNNYRCMLHAFELTIPHPTTGNPIKIVCHPPSDFSSLSSTIITSSTKEEEEQLTA